MNTIFKIIIIQFFDDKEDINAQDGTPAPSQTFKIVVKPRIIEVPSSTPHEKDSPVDPNGIPQNLNGLRD